MKFFCNSKKELKNKIAELENNVTDLTVKLGMAEKEVVCQKKEFDLVREMFPLDLGQTVYDVALRSAAGKYTKKNPSLEHSCVTPVVVTEKNYFSLVKRVADKDVFLSEESAKSYLESVCK